MGLVVDLRSLIELGLTRRHIARMIAKHLKITPAAAGLRLARMEQGDGGINRAALGGLLSIALDHRVWFDQILRIRERSVFDLLPMQRTLTYLGKPKTSVHIQFAARRASLQIGRSWAQLRYSPVPAEGVEPRKGAEALREQVNSKLAEAKTRGLSLLSFGSVKSSPMSEGIICEALGLKAFESAHTDQSVPFLFVFPEHRAEPISIRRRDGKRMALSATAMIDPQAGNEHSHLRWKGDLRCRYRPAEPQGKGGAVVGVDYAVVFLQWEPGRADAQSFGRVVVAGLTGAGTYGATALLCDNPEDFGLPESEVGFIRAFLVQVAFEDPLPQEQPHEPYGARVLARWTRFADGDGGTHQVRAIRDAEKAAPPDPLALAPGSAGQPEGGRADAAPPWRQTGPLYRKFSVSR